MNLLKLVFITMLFLPGLVLAQDACNPAAPTTKLCNGLASFSGGIETVPELVSALLVVLSTIIGTIAIVMFIFGGVQMVFSQGDSGAITTAKQTITYAIIGLAVVMLAYVIVSGIQYLIGVDNNLAENSKKSNFFINPLQDKYLFNPPGESGVPNFLETTIANILSIMGVVTLFFIVWNGFKYILAGGNEDQIKKARLAITWAIFGLASIILSYIIITVVINTLTK